MADAFDGPAVASVETELRLRKQLDQRNQILQVAVMLLDDEELQDRLLRDDAALCRELVRRIKRLQTSPGGRPENRNGAEDSVHPKRSPLQAGEEPADFSSADVPEASPLSSPGHSRSTCDNSPGDGGGDFGGGE